MPLHDPFAAYNAANNVEAHQVCGLLIDAGIEAEVIEDVSPVGLWLGGTIAEIHKPQVWIARADIDRARVILTEFDRRAAERRETAVGMTVAAECEGCGRSSEYLAAQNGTVQICPHCGSYVDVGDDAGIEGWDEASEDGEPVA